MNKLITITLVLSLTGCLYQSVGQADIEAANKICKDKGGIFEVTEYFAGKTTATCRNGVVRSVDVEQRENKNEQYK